MTFVLKQKERALLDQAECQFMAWKKEQDELKANGEDFATWRASVKNIAPEYGIDLPMRKRGSPGKHLAHVWVRMAAECWLAGSPKEPGAQNSRFFEALFAFQVGKKHLVDLSIGATLIEDEVKNWRKVRMP